MIPSIIPWWIPIYISWLTSYNPYGPFRVLLNPRLASSSRLKASSSPMQIYAKVGGHGEGMLNKKPVGDHFGVQKHSLFLHIKGEYWLIYFFFATKIGDKAWLWILDYGHQDMLDDQSAAMPGGQQGSWNMGGRLSMQFHSIHNYGDKEDSWW